MPGWKHLVVLAVFSLGGSALAASAFERKVGALAPVLAQLDGVYAHVWPAGEKNIVENVLTDGREAFVVKNGQVSPYPLEKVAQNLLLNAFLAFGFDREAPRSYYKFPVFFSDVQAVRLIMHENFHRYVQPKTTHSGGSRAQLYPVQPAARELRRATAAALHEALLNPERRADALARAAGFYARWKNNFPEDFQVLRGVDLLEGVPAYFENRAMLEKQFGPTPTAEQVEVFIKANTGKFQVGSGSADTESYPLGTLAGFILDLSPQVTSWKNAADAGKAPIEQLLGHLQPQESAVPFQIKWQVFWSGVSQNIVSGGAVTRAYQNWYQKGPIVVLHGRLNGSFISQGFYQFAGNARVTLAQSASFVTVGGRSLNLGQTTWWSETDEPETLKLLISPQDLTVRDGGFLVKLPHVPQPLQVIHAGQIDGHDVFEMKE